MQTAICSLLLCCSEIPPAPTWQYNTLLLLLHAGAGGLGDATLHHVYSENAGTGDITAAIRRGQLAQQPAGTSAAGRGRRRSSIGRSRQSLAAEAIPEETATPVATAAAADFTEEMALSPERSPALPSNHQQQPLQQEQETPVGEAGPAGGQDMDGMTTNLLLDDRSVGGWGHVIGARVPNTTGRGSVGSNVPTMGLVSGRSLGSVKPFGVSVGHIDRLLPMASPAD